MFQKIQLDNKEKLTAGIACLLLFVFLFLIYDDSIIDKLFPSDDPDANQPIVAQIIDLENDIRYKGSSSLQWKKSSVHQEIRLGDSVFNGANSKSVIELKKGGSVSMGENSLLSFNEIDGIAMPSLSGGNFDLKIDGNLKVTINGELTEFSGTNSQIQVVIKKNEKPEIVLVSGEAKVRTNSINTQSLKKNSKLTMAVPKVIDVKPTRLPSQAQPVQPVQPIQQVMNPIETPVAPQIDLQKTAPAIYFWKLYDLYVKDSGYQFRRLENPAVDLLPILIDLNWTSNPAQNQYVVQVAKDQDFKTLISETTTSDSRLTTSKLALGKNYWRVSSNKVTWSSPSDITIQSGFVKQSPPALRLSDSRPILVGGKATVDFQFLNDSYFKGYILERSTSPAFPSTNTAAYWIGQNQITWTITSPEKTYFRVRGVTDKSELTEFSSVRELQPNFPIILAKKAPRKPVVKIQDEKIEKLKQDSENLKAQVERKPAQEEVAPAVTPEPEVLPEPEPKVEQIVLTTNPDEQRPEPANNTSTTKIVVDPNVYNDSFRKSRVGLTGGLFTMFSASQISQSTQAPIALMGGVRALHWFDHSGLDLLVRTKMVGLNPPAREASPFVADLKYKYRVSLAANPFSSTKLMQAHLIVGYESYKNSGTTSFASSYNLYKAGFGLDFPLLKRLDTGGEVLYGTNSNASKKTEISGYIGYYIKNNFSLDAGYRVNMFEAGSRLDSPTDAIPYREAYGEGYSSFRWHY